MSSYAWLAENLSIPIVGPESFGGKHHMRAEWVKAGACDILRAGANGVGITPTMKVAALAESFGMDCEVHGNGAASGGGGRDPQLPLVRARPAASVPRLR